jgi:MFS family permease
VGRFLGGLSSAGGSVTLGMIADMWDAEHQQYAVAYVVFSSVGGSALGPVVGGTFCICKFKKANRLTYIS